MSVTCKCPVLEDTSYWEVSVFWKYRLLEGAGYWNIFVIGRYRLFGGVVVGRYRLFGRVVVGRYRLFGVVRFWKLYVTGECLVLEDNGYWEVFVFGNSPLLGVSFIERYLLLEVSVTAR